MRRLVTIDLPRRMSRRLPKWVTEVAVGAVTAVLFLLLRAALQPLVGASVPFALAFLAVVLATLIAGWRSGIVAIVAGQLLIWVYVLPPHGSVSIQDPAIFWGLIVTTLTQGVILLALALYQREVRHGQLERARRINFLGHALREMDHRTKNNFQIVTSLLTLQANRSGSPEVQGALKEAAERLKAVAAVYDALAPSSAGLQTVRLQDQLQEICDQIRRGILPEGIELATELEPMLVPHETGVAIGIIVNELVTNACKHAFAGGSGGIIVRTRRDGNQAILEVADNGSGMTAATKNGLGTRLVAAFLQRVHGKSEVQSSPQGTIHMIRVPLGAGS